MLQTDSMAQALRIVRGFEPRAQALADALLDDFCQAVQAAALVSSKGERNRAEDLWFALHRRLARLDKPLPPKLDWTFNLVLIPSDGRILGVAFTAHPEWFCAWCAHPGVQEYAYWDHRDAPSHLSSEEWQRRARAWSVLDYSPACQQGFNYSLTGPFGPTPRVLRSLS